MSTDPDLHSQFLTLEYRHKAIRRLAVTASVLIFPFLVENILNGRYLLSLSILLTLALILRNARAVSAGNVPVTASFAAALLLVIIQVLGVLANGKLAAYWLCPAIIFFFISQGRRRATMFSLLNIVAVIPFIWAEFGPPIALRMLFPALTIISQAHIFLRIIDRLHARLAEQALTDPLTGAYNRRHMQTSVSEAVERFQRYGTISSLAVFDLDHFKKVNDDLGHDAGDHVLCSVVKLMRDRLRNLDLLFRVGGEEFMLLLGDTPGENARRLVEELRATVASSPLLPDRQVTISLGLAALQPGEDAASWLKRADQLLYSAKRSGRNCVVA